MSESSIFAQRRLLNLLRILEEMRESDFPYQDVQDAVDHLHGLVDNVLKQIQDDALIEAPQEAGAPDSAELRLSVRHRRENRSIVAVWNYLPIAGLIQRATHTRNAFELWGPLRRLARQLLQKPEMKFVLSSGWDYIPYALISLKSFVIISLAAPEASNPLLVPVAAHEIGHHVFREEKVQTKFREQIEGQIAGKVSEAIKQHINAGEHLTVEAARLEKQVRAVIDRQLEEYFCDLVGLAIFGESYWHAFAYLLAPDSPPIQNPSMPNYPDVASRSANLIKALDVFTSKFTDHEYTLPAGHTEAFGYLSATPTAKASPVKLGAQVAEELLPLLRDFVADVAVLLEWQSCMPTRSGRESIETEFFRFAVPAEKPARLSDILNAAWRLQLSEDLSRFIGSKMQKDPVANNRWNFVGEITLKTIEMLEYQELLKNEHDTSSKRD